MGSWNQMISQLPLAHFLQTQPWAEVKKSIGWTPNFMLWDRSGELSIQSGDQSYSNDVSAAALALERKVRFGSLTTGLSMLYIPKGPAFYWNSDQGQSILKDVKEFARKKKAIFIKIDPDIILGTGIDGQNAEVSIQGELFQKDLQSTGWLFSPEQIQFRNTFYINLDSQPEDLLSKMKSKTRYNIGLAQRKGVSVRIGTKKDLPELFSMYVETALRDNFILRDKSYYIFAWQSFMDNQMAEPLIAEFNGSPIAAVIVFRFAGKAWYVYGMSREVHRDKMPNYLLQWRAILRAKEHRCSTYDFWGAPNQFTTEDPMWGVYRFKDGFGGQIVRTIGAWDYVLKPNLYHFSMILLPKLLLFLRNKARRQMKMIAQT
jgi:peptidoglycan pentaglycine glycine transferase (the first glycine)